MHKLDSRCFVVVMMVGLALAQAAVTRAQPAPAAPPAAPAPAPAPAPVPPDAVSVEPAATDAPTSPEASCFPACRAGYLCSASQCISACNPPCGVGEQCTATAECVASAPPPPPAAYLGSAPPPPPPPAPETGVHTHDGFMLRATLGFGGGSATESFHGDAFGTGSTSGKVEYAGGGFRLGIDVGGALSDTLTVLGRLSIGTIDEPSMFIDGADYDTPRGTTVSTALLGVGLDYTFMPLNLYLTGVVGLAGIGIHDDDPDTDDDQGEGDVGPGVDLDVGKEWWVGSQLGLGVALRLSFAASDFNSPTYNSDRSSLGAGLLFSLTYQ